MRFTRRILMSARLSNRAGRVAGDMQAGLVATDESPLGDVRTIRQVLFGAKSGKVYPNVVATK
jgi:hypothetical protein